MAEELIVQLKVESKEAKKSLEDFGKTLKKTEQQASDAATKPTKDWKGFAELFSGLLPRNLQGMIRSFKSTQRGVKGVARSFKALKSAYAGLGIGLIVLGLEALVDNWEAVSDAIGLTSEEQRRNEKITQSQNKAYQELDSSTRGYVAVLRDQLATEESVANAVDQLNRSLGNVIDKEATREVQLQQATAALDAKQKADQAEIRVRELQNAVTEDSIALTDDLTNLQTGLMTAFRTPKQIQAAMEERVQQNKNLKKELEEATAVVAEETAAYADLQKQAKEAEEARRKERMEAEAASRASESAAKRAAETRRRIETDTANYLEEVGKTEEEKQVLRLQRKQERERQDAKEANLRADEYAKLLEKQGIELADLEGEIAKRLAKRVEDEQATLDDALRTREQQQIAATQKRYERLFELADKYGRDRKELEAQLGKEIEDIQKQFADKEVRELQTFAELERDLELQSMDERTAKYERMRDEVKAAYDERVKIAEDAKAKRLELAAETGESEELIEREFQDALTAIEQQGADDRKAVQEQENADTARLNEERLEAVLDFVGNVSAALNSVQALRDAQTEQAVIAAKIRGASDEEIAAIEAEAAERERRLAITQVLISQGIAIANAIAGASIAAASTGPGAPFTIGAYIATMVGSVVAGFAQVKSIMNEAAAATIPSPSTGGGGGAPRQPQNVLDPNLAEDFNNPFTGESGSNTTFRSYVVLSDVQGQQGDYGNIQQNASL